MMIGFAMAAAICVFVLIKKTRGFIFPLLSTVIAVGMIVYSLIMGATMQEVLIAVLLLAFLTLPVFMKNGEDE